jgi:hypothetical protein
MAIAMKLGVLLENLATSSCRRIAIGLDVDVDVDVDLDSLDSQSRHQNLP